MKKFLSQPFFTTDELAGVPRYYAKLNDTIDGVISIVDGEGDD